MGHWEQRKFHGRLSILNRDANVPYAKTGRCGPRKIQAERITSNMMLKHSVYLELSNLAGTESYVKSKMGKMLNAKLRSLNLIWWAVRRPLHDFEQEGRW